MALSTETIANLSAKVEERKGKRTTVEPRSISIAAIQAMSEASQIALAMRLGGLVK